MSGESTELARIEEKQGFILAMGKMFAESGLFGCKNIPQGVVLAMHCVIKGISPLVIMQKYHLIDGKLSMRADAMLAGLLAEDCDYTIISRTSEKAEIEIEGRSGKQRFSLTWEEAQKEPFTKTKDGSIKHNWATPRSRMQMLWARVCSDGVRVMAPQVVCGVYAPEELSDEEQNAITIPASDVEVKPTASAQVITEEPQKAGRGRPRKTEAQSTTTSPPDASGPLVEGARVEPVSVTPAATLVTTPVQPEPAKTIESVPDLSETDYQKIVRLRDSIAEIVPDKKQFSVIWGKALAFTKLVIAGKSEQEGIDAGTPEKRAEMIRWLFGQHVAAQAKYGTKTLDQWAAEKPGM